MWFELNKTSINWQLYWQTRWISAGFSSLVGYERLMKFTYSVALMQVNYMVKHRLTCAENARYGILKKNDKKIGIIVMVFWPVGLSCLPQFVSLTEMSSLYHWLGMLGLSGFPIVNRMCFLFHRKTEVWWQMQQPFLVFQMSADISWMAFLLTSLP